MCVYRYAVCGQEEDWETLGGKHHNIVSVKKQVVHSKLYTLPIFYYLLWVWCIT